MLAVALVVAPALTYCYHRLVRAFGIRGGVVTATLVPACALALLSAFQVSGVLFHRAGEFPFLYLVPGWLAASAVMALLVELRYWTVRL